MGAGSKFPVVRDALSALEICGVMTIPTSNNRRHVFVRSIHLPISKFQYSCPMYGGGVKGGEPMSVVGVCEGVGWGWAEGVRGLPQ